MKTATNLVSVGVLSILLVLTFVACAGCTESPVNVPKDEQNTPDISENSIQLSKIPDLTFDYRTPVFETKPTVTQGGYIRITVTAPYGDYHVVISPSGIIPHGQTDVDTQTPPYTQNYAKIHVGTSGKLSFTIKSVSTDDITVQLVD